VKWFVVIATIALAVTASASAEVVARAPTGMLAATPRGQPLVGYLRDRDLVIARRAGRNRWTSRPVARLPKDSILAALAAAPAGTAAVVLGPRDRSVLVVYRRAKRWVTTTLTPRLPAGVFIGWPGLALDHSGLPVVAYTRWHFRTRYSHLVLARISARGQVHSQRVTVGGFPKSDVAPPAAPIVLPNGVVHVVQTYGITGVTGTFEWVPQGKTWVGLGLAAGYGSFPVGPMFVARRGKVVYSAWSEAFIAMGDFPVLLAQRTKEIASSDIVAVRGLTTGLALTRHGPSVAANDWVRGDDFGFPTGNSLWAGTVSGRFGSELDGRIDGYVTVPRSRSQDLLLARGGALSWFRTNGSLPVQVTMEQIPREDGVTMLTGRVQGSRGGHVSIYREGSANTRELAGTVRLTPSGTFTFVETRARPPTIYRAVYTDPATGIPYAKLLREPVG
jgi:hypothetical protein